MRPQLISYSHLLPITVNRISVPLHLLGYVNNVPMSYPNQNVEPLASSSRGASFPRRRSKVAVDGHLHCPMGPLPDRSSSSLLLPNPPATAGTSRRWHCVPSTGALSIPGRQVTSRSTTAVPDVHSATSCQSCRELRLRVAQWTTAL